ncbi:MAG: diguanylate cyclase [Candidatus Eremiobacteraeota bacterium]|nr:diguanylate cyclase [Candidatus Eremiobacteraeota bacterium]
MVLLATAATAVVTALVVLCGVLVRKLRDAEDRRQRYAAVFDNATDMMCVYRLDGTIVRANAAALKRLGFGAELAGKNFSAHVAPESLLTTERAFAQAVSGRSIEFSTVFLDAHGDALTVMASLAPIAVRERIVGVVGSARDVSAEEAHEEELLRNRERFRGLFEQNAFAMATIKTDGTLSAINVAMERLSGYRNEELVGKPATILTPPDRRELARRRLAELTASPAPMSYESELLCRGDHEVAVGVDILPIEVVGRIEGYYMTVKDLTEERALRGRLGESDARVSALYRVASSGSNPSLQIDEALALGTKSLRVRYGCIVEVSGDRFTVRHRCGPEDDVMPVGFTAPLGPAIERVAQSPRATTAADLEPPWKSSIGSRIVADGKPYGALIFLDTQTRDGAFEPADVDFADLLATLAGGAVSRELAHQRLEEGSLCDALTGLANRTLLEQSILRAIATAGRRQRKFAVLFLDLDRFKPVNDERGHAAGDLVLKEVARRLRETLRAEDLVARVGGDEFVILQTDVEKLEATGELAERVSRALSHPMAVGGVQLQIGCSIGVAVYPYDGKTAAELMHCADVAMYRAKMRNRETV